MGLGGECHRMVMGYAGETPGAGLRVIFDLKLGSLSRCSGGATHASHWLPRAAACERVRRA